MLFYRVWVRGYLWECEGLPNSYLTTKSHLIGSAIPQQLTVPFERGHLPLGLGQVVGDTR